jgi:predicted RNA-binding protein YlxR (DUF448 family)
MVRVVAAPDGAVHVGRHAPGRGAWLCGPGCVPRAAARRAFDRALRRQIAPGAIESLVRELQAMPDRDERLRTAERSSTTNKKG